MYIWYTVYGYKHNIILLHTMAAVVRDKPIGYCCCINVTVQHNIHGRTAAVAVQLCSIAVVTLYFKNSVV